MSLFSFQAEQTFTSSAAHTLKGGEIYKVKLSEVKYEQIEDKNNKNNGNPYNVLTIVFSNDDGTYTHRLFEPIRPTDNERRKFQNGGELPSAVEEQQMFIGQLLTIFSPESLKKLIGKNVNFVQLAKFIAKELESAIGKETNIKLMLNNKGYAVLANCAAVSNDGKLYAKNSIGDNLSFTAAELKRIQTLQEAKPTNVKDMLKDEDVVFSDNDGASTLEKAGPEKDSDVDFNL